LQWGFPIATTPFEQADPNKRQVKERDPPSAVGGLEGIDKRVGSWELGEEKVKKKRRKASTSGFTSAAQ